MFIYIVFHFCALIYDRYTHTSFSVYDINLEAHLRWKLYIWVRGSRWEGFFKAQLDTRCHCSTPRRSNAGTNPTRRDERAFVEHQPRQNKLAQCFFALQHLRICPCWCITHLQQQQQHPTRLSLQRERWQSKHSSIFKPWSLGDCINACVASLTFPLSLSSIIVIIILCKAKTTAVTSGLTARQMNFWSSQSHTHTHKLKREREREGRFDLWVAVYFSTSVTALSVD